MNEQVGESQPAPLPPRPNRRPSRPRRRGGRRRPPEARGPAPEPVPEGQEQPVSETTPESATREQPPRREPPPQARHQPQRQRPSGSPIGEAVALVEEIIKTLKDSLRDLEEVLETLDDAQRQQIGDEKEIESLRRSLSMLQRERYSPPREQQRSRPSEQRPPADQPE